MGMIRTAVVAGVLIYAIPADPQKQHALVQSASDTFVWGATYCQREPETCRQAGDFLAAAVQKARFGVTFVEEVANKWPRHRESGRPDTEPAGLEPAGATGAAGRGTLTIEDLLAASPEQPASPSPTAQNLADPSLDG